MLGAPGDSPSSEYIQKAFPNLHRFQKVNLPLKTKQVGIIDVAALTNLPAHYPDAAAFLQSVAAYLWDSSRYDHVPPPSALKHTGFTAAEEQLMLNSKFGTFNGRPRGSVFGFKTAQFSKGCSRPVWN